MKTSAPASDVVRRPGSPSGFVSSAYSRLGRRQRPGDLGTARRLRSQPTIVAAPPAFSSIFVTATPAAPTPVDHDLDVARGRLPTTRRALMSAANTTIAVPCWSSWKTGMSSSSRSRRSTSKQRGAEMSSRLIPPKPGAIALTAATISSTSFVARHDREGVDASELLEQHRLALHHRQRCRRPDVAETEDGGPVGHDRDRVALDRQVHTCSGSSAIARQTRATPGV